MDTYESSRKQFAKWCIAHNRIFFPATPETVAHYLRYMCESGYAEQTIKGHPTDSELVQKAKERAVAEAAPGAEGKYPLLRDDLFRILQLPCKNWRDSRDGTMILLQWISMMRVGSMVKLRVEDVWFHQIEIDGSPCDYMILRLRHLKNHKGEKLVYIGQGTALFCVIRWVRAYLKEMKGTFRESFSDSSPLFFNARGSSLRELSKSTPSSRPKEKVSKI